MLLRSAHGAGENRVTYNRHVRRVVTPGADDVSDAVVRVAGRFAVRNAQAAKHDEIVTPVTVLRRRAFGVCVQMNFGKAFANRLHGCDVVVVRVRDEKVFELKLVFPDQFENGLGVPAGVEQRGVTRDFVPYQIAMHLGAAFDRADLAKFAPRAQVFG